MRARTTVAGLALLVALAGCTPDGPIAQETSATPTASATPTPTPTITTTPRTRLDCDSLLPASRAATVLGLERNVLVGSRAQPFRSSAELIRESAEHNGGLLTCSWYEQKGLASITASAAGDAAEAFAGRTGTRLASEVEAYGSCADGTCDVELLAGTTWVSLQLTGAPADIDLAALATSTAASAIGSFDEPETATAPVCATLLTPEQLSTTAGLVQATPGSGTEGTTPATAVAAAAARAGYASCSWSDASNSAFSGLTVDALPNGEDGWRNLSLTSGLSIVLEPLDGIGDKALAGCSAGSCEIDVLDDELWWRVVVTGDEERAEAVTRAVLAAS
ncbi:MULTISPECIES: hypothetical protein [unclassified Rathayibacter]|uniref:hypothetical protein n=1 Tax=unclassified Rathayibacter TaxID=2609250 RepID=UPI001889D15F|nr:MULTISPECIES: hypothetical protein [unclassified Rathayibacter]MBF4460986.1 hypothetical protein [Rathayibacter sp. VKM Ac-2879]MBF4502397.1 hypothetical protein [Rathayibacter sp. VKM Ac-2878]